MWTIEPTEQWEKDQRWYTKKHPNELAAVLVNLERYVRHLNSSKNSKVVMAGYLHHEPLGVVAVDQKGGGGNLQETRLYTFADDTKNILYLITIGNKSDQPRDIEIAKEFVQHVQKT